STGPAISKTVASGMARTCARIASSSAAADGTRQPGAPKPRLRPRSNSACESGGATLRRARRRPASNEIDGRAGQKRLDVADRGLDDALHRLARVKGAVRRHDYTRHVEQNVVGDEAFQIVLAGKGRRDKLGLLADERLLRQHVER